MQQGHSWADPLFALSLSFFPVAEPGLQSGPSHASQPYDAAHPEVPAVHPPAAGKARACGEHVLVTLVKDQDQEWVGPPGSPLNNCRPPLQLQVDGPPLEESVPNLPLSQGIAGHSHQQPHR